MYISKIKFINSCFNEEIIHSQLYAAFPSQMGRMLYKKENRIENNKLATYAITFSEKKPFSTDNVEILASNEVTPIFYKNEVFNFEIKLAPEYKMYGKRLPQKINAKRMQYVQNRLESVGATILTEIQEGSRETIRVKHETGIQLITSYIYKGKLIVTNPLLFRDAYKKGIGHNKAYGCGMLLLKR